ncbi:MAG TPA: helix-turn-helix transcriptional regulator [Bacillota bacterium]|mgnify:CR=1 FL=1|nr:helix-turn-helix transcriptional regulator [Bacillota bacterium]
MAKREYLIKLRKERRWTQKEVAAQLGISDRLYGMFETGIRTPKLHIALKIQELFGEPLDVIFYDLKPNEMSHINDEIEQAVLQFS